MNGYLATVALLALRAIRRHALRSVLTTLGIVIGTFAVVTMVTLGRAATEQVRQQIAGLGANLLTVIPGKGFGPGGGRTEPPPFRPADVDAIRDQLGGITAVAPIATAAVTAVRNAANWSTTVTGAGDAYLDAEGWPVAEGRPFTPAEEEAGKSVCLIGTTVRDTLYRSEPPLGTQLRLGGVTCAVVGVLSPRGGGFRQDEDDAVVMPLKTVQRRLTGDRAIRVVIVAADPAYDSAAIQESIAALLRERRGVRPGAEDDFSIFDNRQIATTLSSTVGVLTSVVGAVAAISLLVGGIGIMNIMLVSVTERTREIGIRLAIGAVAREVMMQFLVEAVVLSCLGGIAGLVLALAATFGLARAFGLPFAFDPGINALAFLFSALIGVVFGYFPARRAAALDPIEALRHE